MLDGDLAAPGPGGSIVLFAHGSGSSRHSPRNQYVAKALSEAGFGTLLMDLLTAEEERARDLRFDIPVLAERLTAAVDWLTGDWGVFLFGASTGAAAALVAAADRPDRVLGVVSRGGRPDLAGDAAGRQPGPVLLIVGGNDPTVLELNKRARQRIGPSAELVVIPGATHLFAEPGALDGVITATVYWLRRWTAPGG